MINEKYKIFKYDAKMAKQNKCYMSLSEKFLFWSLLTLPTAIIMFLLEFSEIDDVGYVLVEILLPLICIMIVQFVDSRQKQWAFCTVVFDKDENMGYVVQQNTINEAMSIVNRIKYRFWKKDIRPMLEKLAQNEKHVLDCVEKYRNGETNRSFIQKMCGRPQFIVKQFRYPTVYEKDTQGTTFSYLDEQNQMQLIRIINAFPELEF